MREKLEALAKELDCGDHSCRYAVDKTGQRTNGGCRCTVRQVTEWGIRMRDAILAAAEPDPSLRDAVVDVIESYCGDDDFGKGASCTWNVWKHNFAGRICSLFEGAGWREAARECIHAFFNALEKHVEECSCDLCMAANGAGQRLEDIASRSSPPPSKPGLRLSMKEIQDGILKQKATSEYQQVSIVLVRNVFDAALRGDMDKDSKK